jgi:hypothetical protein
MLLDHLDAILKFCNLLVGYGARGANTRSVLLLVLPLIVSISFLLIADIDSPRSGLIHVVPQNLVSSFTERTPFDALRLFDSA